MLGRGPNGMLSDGADRKLLRTCVQFLAGHEGQYQLGSVHFRADAEQPASSAVPSDRHPEVERPADTGGKSELFPSIQSSAMVQIVYVIQGFYEFWCF